MLMKLDDSFQGYIFDLFLYTGETWAVLQSDGTIPVVTDLLNNMVRIGAISTESYFKSFGLISFGPAALDGFKLHKRFCLPSVFMVKCEIFGCCVLLLWLRKTINVLMFTFRHTWWHVTLFVKVSSRNI
jgi:hypothetical protein